MKQYSGSGIIPIIIIDNKPYFVLFYLKKNIVTDAGGRIEYNNSVLNTASRELFEESAGLINISENTLDSNSFYIDIKNEDKYYRSYIIIIDSINTDDYYKNLNKINKFKFNPFSETHGIRLISLDYIDFINNDIIMHTNTDKIVILSKRTKHIIKKIYNKFDDFKIFFKKISKSLNIIKLNKTIISTESYEYASKKKIKIHDLITYIN
jgi:hypothetical protein